MIDIEKVSEDLLSDLPGYDKFKSRVNSVKKELQTYHSEQYDKWLEQTTREINRKVLR